MKFNVIGADKDGDSIEMTLEATDTTEAQETASRKGIVVTAISPIQLDTQRTPIASGRHPIQQPFEQGHHPGAPTVNVALPRRGSSLGVASLALGVLALLICWIPFLNLLGVPLAALGMLLGGIGFLVALLRKGAGIGYPIAGIAICGLSLFVAFTMTNAMVGGMRSAGEQMIAENAKRNTTNQSIVSQEITAAPTPIPTAIAEPSAPPTFAAPVEPAAPAVQWASAEAAVKQGDIQVQVKSSKIDKVALKGIMDDAAKSEDPLLRIGLEVKNLSQTKKVDFKGWGGVAMSFDTHATLADNFGNQYKLINFGIGTTVVGAAQSESVYPEKSIQDAVVFEQPIEKAEYLNLELPAENFGGTGMIRIRIPASMLQK